jgi:hypothetical protein
MKAAQGRRMAILILSLAIFQNINLNAQQFTVSGHITDKASGETLIGAGASCGNAGSVTNEFGFYTLTLKGGKGISITYSYVGYDEQTVVLNLQKDSTINIALSANSEITEAIVSAKKESGMQATKMSAIEIPINIVKATPTLFGEADVLKTIQLMPGVQAGNEGFSGIYVRGGGPDENLLLLDGISMYNAEHMLGLFSIFQPEAVKKVTLYKGSFPARYGGRISSIIDIRTNDGNMEESHGTIGVGVISDKFHLEGPIFKGKTSYSISARGMHTILFDPLIRILSHSLSDEGSTVYGNYFFYDLNGKITHRISDRDRLHLNTYYGRDALMAKDIEDNTDDQGSSYNDKSSILWGNALASLRWNHVFNGRLFSNTSVALTSYRMHMGYDSKNTDVYSDGTKSKSNYKFDYNSGMRDITAMMDFDYTPNPRHAIKFGGQYIFHTFIPETYSTKESEREDGHMITDTSYTNHSESLHGHEISAYIEDDFAIGKWLDLNPGIHFAVFNTQGKFYMSPEPRLSAKAIFGNGFSAKASYSRMAQYVHLLSSAMITLPLDLWVPITKSIKPVTANQYSLGVYCNNIPGWEFSIEGYWKDMDNILEYKDGVSFVGSSQGWQDLVVMGEGRAYGVELFVQKTMGKTTGWIGYTLAKSERRFPGGEINFGEWFPYRYDRRHNISIVVNHEFSKRVDISATWVYATGGTTTIPERTMTVEGPDGTIHQVNYSPYRNNYRLPESHRLNLSVNVHRQRRRGERTWSFGLYNAYNRLNPNFVFVRQDSSYDSGDLYIRRMKLKSITILPIIPSISYTFNF